MDLGTILAPPSTPNPGEPDTDARNGHTLGSGHCDGGFTMGSGN